MKKIVLFGATGTLGAYTAIDLKENGYDVFAIGKRRSDNSFFHNNNIEYLSLDIVDDEGLKKLPTNVDSIIHFAGTMPAHMDGYMPKDYLRSIILGTYNILEYANRIGCKRLVFSQSIADILYLFGTTEPILPDVERRNPEVGDHSMYSISKNAAVNMIEHYYYQYGIKRFILRLPTIYAYHPNPFYYVNGIKKWMGFRLIMDKAMKGEPIEIWGDPKSSKEIVYVKDFTQIVQRSIEAECDGGLYNVGRGVGVSMEEQVRGIVDVFSPTRKKSVISYNVEKPSSPQFVLDIKKTQGDLGYIPKFNYREYLIDYKKEKEKQFFQGLWGTEDNYY
jgi:nucleoside-diphosphate-sugar epimerase